MLRFLRDITFLLTLCVVSCDSLSGDPEPALPPAGDSKTALAQAWYEEALVRTQTRMGKQEHPAVLAAMVKQYPPDWSQAVSLPIGSGITRVTTVLGPQQPATTRSHTTLAAVRTISVDVSQNNEVVGSRLLELVSPDSLAPGSFADYVRQWGSGILRISGC